MSQQSPLQRVLSQLPSNITEDTAVRVLHECGGDETLAVCTLLDISERETRKPSVLQSKFNNMRDICDAYDEAMQLALKPKST